MWKCACGTLFEATERVRPVCPHCAGVSIVWTDEFDMKVAEAWVKDLAANARWGKELASAEELVEVLRQNGELPRWWTEEFTRLLAAYL